MFSKCYGNVSEKNIILCNTTKETCFVSLFYLLRKAAAFGFISRAQPKTLPAFIHFAEHFVENGLVLSFWIVLLKTKCTLENLKLKCLIYFLLQMF